MPTPPPPPAAAYPPPPPPPAGAPVTVATAYAPPPAFATAGAHVKTVIADLDPATLRPTVIVAGVIFGIWLIVQVLGLIAPAAATNGGTQGGTTGGTQGNTGGDYITVGNLRFGLAAGWRLGTNDQAAGRVTNGNAYMDIYVYNGTGQPKDLYNQYNENQGQSAGGFNAAAPSPISLNGLQGVRGTYFGTFNGAGAVDGEVTVVVSGGKGYVFDVWASGGTLNQSLADAEQMLSTLQVTQ